MAITVDGKRYKVVEDMGFNHSTGTYAKVVKAEDGERVAVRPPGGVWRFWEAKDRARPLAEAAARGWPKRELGN